MTAENELFPPNKAGEYLGGVPYDTLRWWRYKRVGPRFVRIGTRKVAYRKSDLDAFIAQGLTETQEAANAR
ncbi:DNA-binding protein [Rhizobium sp. WSM4643]|uniref:helix-turn-helix transcriptional regulator n=1 Tax=Rhizobium sp. WSM4643 TaxID=3138253 RepID=UPI0021A38A94|nr:DNA-binding protein [Rhizobium leguminosarum]UWM77432.1 DNA-binding protein [Rhizobium leguminosarum bv. viciae]